MNEHLLERFVLAAERIALALERLSTPPVVEEVAVPAPATPDLKDTEFDDLVAGMKAKIEKANA